MRRVALVAGLVATTLIASADAWWCTGHMVIAEMARQNLDAGVEALVNEQFAFLNQFFPQSNNMISGACWADDLKSSGLEVMEGWHFINQIYNPENVTINTSNYPIQRINVATAITDLGKTMDPHSWDKKDLNQWIKAYAVANLIHFIGDIHQPLHATERFNANYPDGDRGATLIHVNWDNKEWALHFIWDSVCAQYNGEPTRPLNATDYAYIQSLASQYTANFTVPEAMKKTYESSVMAQESYDAAVKFAYANNTITKGQNLTQAYMDQCKWVAGYRIAYAGYRLASELNYIFGTSMRDAPVAHIVKRIVETKKSFGEGLKQGN